MIVAQGRKANHIVPTNAARRTKTTAKNACCASLRKSSSRGRRFGMSFAYTGQTVSWDRTKYPATNSPSSNLSDYIADSIGSSNPSPDELPIKTFRERKRPKPDRIPSPSSAQMRRPPLPVVTLPTPISLARSRAQTPLASPSLATYQAPEELEAGPSKLHEYFQNEEARVDDSTSSDETLIEELNEEHHHYFREPVRGTVRLTAPVLPVQIPQQPEPEFPIASGSRSLPAHVDSESSQDELDSLTAGPSEHRGPTVPEQIDTEEEPEMPELELMHWNDHEDDAEVEEDDEGAIMPFGEVENDELPFARPPVRPPPPRRPLDPRPARPEQDAIDQEEIDAAMEDDMDGALEG